MADDKTRIQTIAPPLPGASLGVAARFIVAPVNPEPQDDPIGVSQLGTPIYTSLVLNAISGNDLNNIPPDQQEIVGQDFELQEVLMTVAQSKNIVKTPLNGRDGTVKEYIANGDYSITVEGRFVSPERLVRPRDAVKALTVFAELKQSLEVSSNFLSQFGITNVVVNDYSFHEVEGMLNQIEFRLLMWSDTEFKIEPTQENINASQGDVNNAIA